MKTALTIAGFDPSSGAGVTADLMVFAAHGLFGTSAMTSLTVQSTIGVADSRPTDARYLRDTLDYLQHDLPPAGIKVGMLSTKDIVSEVASFLRTVRQTSGQPWIVIDPVLRSSSGRELLSSEAVEVLVADLFPLADVVTPNTQELSILTGLPTTTPQQIEDAARHLIRRTGCGHVVATGGEENPPRDLIVSSTVPVQWISGERVNSFSTHGTGCAFSSAVLAGLVRGDAPHQAVISAKKYVAEGIRRATPLGHGHGPLNHLWPLKST